MPWTAQKQPPGLTETQVFQAVVENVCYVYLVR